MTSSFELGKGVDRYIDAFDGNRFEACKAISNDAVHILKLSGDSIMESEAISWALTGKPPSNIEERPRQHMNLTIRRSAYMDMLLSYVDDDDILDCVKESYAQSIRLGSLTYYYPVKLSKENKTRVRVLTRMCWYNRKGM